VQRHQQPPVEGFDAIGSGTMPLSKHPGAPITGTASIQDGFLPGVASGVVSRDMLAAEQALGAPLAVSARAISQPRRTRGCGTFSLHLLSFLW